MIGFGVNSKGILYRRATIRKSTEKQGDTLYIHAGKASPQHPNNQQDVDEAKHCSQESRSGVHVELQVYDINRDTTLSNE